MTTLKQQAATALANRPIDYFAVGHKGNCAGFTWCDEHKETIRKCLSLLARDDIAIVPLAPTNEMLTIGYTIYADSLGTYLTRQKYSYQAMISAAPDVMETGE